MKLQDNSQKIAYCFLVSNEGRDFYLLLPFIYYLEKYENFKVSFEFVWDAYKMRKKRPDLVILPNVRGQLLYWEIADYCKNNHILVFHHDSEGNFNTENDQYDYWGFNKTKEIYSPVLFTWNKIVYNYLEVKFPYLSNVLKISGAPGFDKYKYMSQVSRDELLTRYGMQHFKKVVGYAGWAFGKIYHKAINDILTNLKLDKIEGRKWLENQRDLVEAILKKAIESNPDILFILKKHPRENFESDNRDSRNEMNRLKDYSNVLYLKDQEEIQNLIAISDLWMAFESTSIMEAWLMDKPTVMINPEVDFVRAEIYKGSLIVKNYTDLLKAIHELFENKNKKYFSDESIVKNRKTIFTNSIGFGDGVNHLRCAYYFKPYLNQLNKNNGKPGKNVRFLRLYLFLHLGKCFYNKSLFAKLPKFKKTIWVYENYRLSKINQLKAEVYIQLDEFYKQNLLDSKIKNGTIWEEIDL